MPHATTQTARTPSRWQAPQRAEGRLCTRAGLPGCMIRPELILQPRPCPNGKFTRKTAEERTEQRSGGTAY